MERKTRPKLAIWLSLGSTDVLVGCVPSVKLPGPRPVAAEVAWIFLLLCCHRNGSTGFSKPATDQMMNREVFGWTQVVEGTCADFLRSCGVLPGAEATIQKWPECRGVEPFPAIPGEASPSRLHRVAGFLRKPSARPCRLVCLPGVMCKGKGI